jgi:hypothetical protein
MITLGENVAAKIIPKRGLNLKLLLGKMMMSAGSIQVTGMDSEVAIMR